MTNKELMMLLLQQPEDALIIWWNTKDQNTMKLEQIYYSPDQNTIDIDLKPQ